MANTIDERLLAGNQENDAAKELKEKKRGQAGEEGGDEASATGQPRSLRQRVRAARQAMDLKQKVKDKIEGKVTAPAKAGTSNALRWAWMTLIPSFGLSLIYINIHVFLKSVFGEKLFCKLGEEWIPKQVAGAGGEAGKTVSKSIGLVEVMGLLLLDLLFLIIILAILAIFLLICDIIQNPLGYIGAALGMAWDAVTGFFIGK